MTNEEWEFLQQLNDAARPASGSSREWMEVGTAVAAGREPGRLGALARAEED